jgi:hypothetical protein
MDHAIVELREGFGLEENRLRLGTPDLAAASKLVADEHQRRTPRFGAGDAGQRRCGGHRQAAHHQRPSVEHKDILLVEPFYGVTMVEAAGDAKPPTAGFTAL